MTVSDLDLYKGMLRIRVVEETIADHYPEQEMRCPVHLCIGQEAVATGVCSAMQRRDYVLSGHRSHGHYLAKGGSLKAMMAEIYGRAAGCAKGKGGSMHLVDLDAGFLGAAPIVGSTIPIGVGAAFGCWQRGEDNVTVVFFGDGATEAGVFHESLDFAVLKNLPVVFVCENNLYSVYSPMEVRQSNRRSIVTLAQAHGMHAERGDGNNVKEVFRIANAAIKKARSGQGPSLLEFTTYRWREHCGPNLDNDIGYRTEEEYQAWKILCPVEAMAAKLVETSDLSNDQASAIGAELRQEAEQAIVYAKACAFPDASKMTTEVYATEIAR